MVLCVPWVVQATIQGSIRKVSEARTGQVGLGVVGLPAYIRTSTSGSDSNDLVKVIRQRVQTSRKFAVSGPRYVVKDPGPSKQGWRLVVEADDDTTWADGKMRRGRFCDCHPRVD